MKKLFISGLFLLSSINLMSQDPDSIVVTAINYASRNPISHYIELEFSYLVESPDSTHRCPPYLQITYKNKTERDYYLPLLLPPNERIPNYAMGALGCDMSREHQLKDSPQLDSLNNYLHNRIVFNEDHYELALSFIQTLGDEELSFTKNCLRSSKRLLTSSAIVFLDAGACVKQLISLQKFVGTGILLTIYLATPNPPHGIKADNTFVKLPRKIYGYHLYGKPINYKSITIDFSNTKSFAQ